MTGGPFRFSRDPIHTGGTVGLLGLALLLDTAAGVAVVVALAVVAHNLTLAEERYLGVGRTPPTHGVLHGPWRDSKRGLRWREGGTCACETWSGSWPVKRGLERPAGVDVIPPRSITGWPRKEAPVKITVETVVRAELITVWDAWNNPADIKQWNTAQDDWHTTRSAVGLREGGKFLSRMEAKDGSEGFDFEGTYTRIVPETTIEYRMSDGREVEVEFVERAGGVLVRETFDAESENPPELQRTGWQAILDSFRRHVEAKE